MHILSSSAFQRWDDLAKLLNLPFIMRRELPKPCTNLAASCRSPLRNAGFQTTSEQFWRENRLSPLASVVVGGGKR
jgi:hypothetical protein